MLSATDFIRRDGEGHVEFDTRAANTELHRSEVLWSTPFPPHSVENAGATDLRVTMVELKGFP